LAVSFTPFLWFECGSPREGPKRQFRFRGRLPYPEPHSTRLSLVRPWMKARASFRRQLLKLVLCLKNTARFAFDSPTEKRQSNRVLHWRPMVWEVVPALLSGAFRFSLNKLRESVQEP
jgi:hypothetical protein